MFACAFTHFRQCWCLAYVSSLVESDSPNRVLTLVLVSNFRLVPIGLILVESAAMQLNSSLLSISVGAVLLPAAYHFAIASATDATSVLQKENILRMSHGVSVPPK